MPLTDDADECNESLPVDCFAEVDDDIVDCVSEVWVFDLRDPEKLEELSLTYHVILTQLLKLFLNFSEFFRFEPLLW